MAYGNGGGINPFMFSMMADRGGGSSIPEQTRAPDFVDQYLRGQQLREMQQNSAALNAEREAQAQDTALKAQQIKQAQTLQAGVQAYAQGGKAWDSWQQANPGMGPQVQDHVQVMKATGFLTKANGAKAIMDNIPLTPAGFQAYNSTARQQLLDMGVAAPQFKDYPEFVDGFQSLDDKAQSVYSAATNYAGMVRENADPNSPYYRKLTDQIKVMEDTSKAKLGELLAQTNKANADASAATSKATYGGKTKPTLGALQGTAMAYLQKLPGYQDWLKSQNDPKAAEGLAKQIAGSVQNGYGPKGIYVGQNPDDAVKAEAGRVNFSSQHWYSPTTSSYVPSGSTSSAPAAAAPSAAGSITRQGSDGKTYTLVNGQWVAQ